ncbi:hypothetical protein [Microbacterium oxydans]|uniref:hypothetical protein n=1 Tax=Microbacterium oxydans TaxID=82380 RepID=UPI0022B1F74F|nr:hypothetical protein [Microbacterium oxydans]MCZ4301273.1 hypothetical protein [Microbacterium oxydans]
MSALDVVQIPGRPGLYARRAVVNAWEAAGSPPINSAGRLYAEQKRLYDGWRDRKPGFNPADNPDDETQRLAHVRFVALDIDPSPARVRALQAAGLVRPYSYEPWHWELPNVRQYPIVRSLPATAGNQSEEDNMNAEQDRRLEAVFQAVFGAANVPANETGKITWAKPFGEKGGEAYYGIFDVLLDIQKRLGKIEDQLK